MSVGAILCPSMWLDIQATRDLLMTASYLNTLCSGLTRTLQELKERESEKMYSHGFKLFSIMNSSGPMLGFAVNFVVIMFAGVYFNLIIVKGQDGTAVDNENKVGFEKVFTFGINPSYGRDEARTEYELLLSKLDGAYVAVVSKSNIRPIVDTIQENEKYGNDGAFGRKVATGLINTFDGLAHVVNGLLDAPTNAKNQVGKEITGVLNQIGGAIVGL